MRLLTPHFVLLALFLLSLNTMAAHAAQYTGRLEWVHKVELRVLESGIVTKMKVTVGQQVKKGDLLLQIDQREFKAKLTAAKAVLSRVKATVAKSKRDYLRTQELYERALIADEELKDAELQQAIANADEVAAQAAYDIAQIALERTELRAPFNAIVIAHNTWKGDVIYKTIQQKPPLIIAPSQQMLARILVTANVLHQYRQGQKATVTLRGKRYSGKVHSLGVEAVRIEPNGAVYELDVLFKRDKRAALRESEVVQVSFP